MYAAPNGNNGPVMDQKDEPESTPATASERPGGALGPKAHSYLTSLHWEGSTGAGYDSYSRDHEISAPFGASAIFLSADPVFRGVAERWNPEQMVVGAASSCQMLSFLAVAARARVDVVSYDDDATGEMPVRERGEWIERIVLRPRIVVAGTVDERRLRRLVEVAHRDCYVAGSLRSEIAVEPVFEMRPREAPSTESSYAFGDGHDAAARLASMAEIFEEPSRSFLARCLESSGVPVDLAVDLGCGPGYSTALLLGVSGARCVAGLDESPDFLAIAERRLGDRALFRRHDLRETPWPSELSAASGGAAPGLAYARLVLAHLAEPEALAARWLGELGPGGLLLLEEIEWIRTDESVLAHYLDLATDLVAAHGGAMLAGPLVDRLDLEPAGHVISSTVVEWPVATHDAARMFAMNLAVWRDDPEVVGLVASPDELDELASALEQIAGGAFGSGGRIVWGLRQAALRRAG